MQISLDLPLKSGGVFKWRILNVALLIQHYAEQSELYRRFLRHAFENYELPFSAIIHEDEVTPGNIVLMRRKVHGWYLSLREFGLWIRNENSWIHFASLQSDLVHKISGEFACVSRMLYKAIAEHSESILQSGIAVDIGGEHRLLCTSAYTKCYWFLTGALY